MKQVLSIILIFVMQSPVLAVAEEQTVPLFSCENYKSKSEYQKVDPKIKTLLDDQIKDRAIRLKLSNIYDIVVSGSQRWLDLSGAAFHKAPTCEYRVFEYYNASRQGAEYALSNTESGKLREQKENLISSRIKII